MKKSIRVIRDKPAMRVVIPVKTKSIWALFHGDNRCLFSWMEDHVNVKNQWSVYEIQNCAYSMCFDGWLVSFDIETHENNMLGRLLHHLDRKLKEYKVMVEEEKYSFNN